MRQAVVNTQECVGERHTGNRRSVMHFLTSQLIAFKSRFFKVLEYQLDCFDGKTIGVVVSQYRNISFDRVSQHVHTGISNS
ncbi:hypothetical protein D3C76_1755770 [compost metagenome]